MKRWMLIGTVLFLAVAAAAQFRPSQEQTRARDQAYNPGAAPAPAVVAAGKAVFLSHCGFCHGDDATGRTGPNLLNSPVILHDVNGSTLGPFVRHGVPAAGMPAFPQLSEGEIVQIAGFLQARVRLAADRFEQTLPEVVDGNPAAGKAYFDQHCSTCHSVTGNLAGVAAKYPPAELMSRIAYPRAYGQGQNGVTATIVYPSGKTVRGPLVHQDEFNVELTGANGVHRVYPVTGATVTLHDPLTPHVELLRHYTDADLRNLVAFLEKQK